MHKAKRTDGKLDKMRFQLARLLFLVSIAAQCCKADVYIVDGVNGDDGNSGGDVNDAFKTVARCVQSLSKPGDECQIRAGFYHEAVTINGLKGTTAEPIRITGYEDERPVMDGTVTIQPKQWNFGWCS